MSAHYLEYFRNNKANGEHVRKEATEERLGTDGVPEQGLASVSVYRRLLECVCVCLDAGGARDVAIERVREKFPLERFSRS